MDYLFSLTLPNTASQPAGWVKSSHYHVVHVKMHADCVIHCSWKEVIEKISMKGQKDISIYKEDKSLKLSVKSFSTTNLAEYYFRGLKLLPKSHSLDYSHIQSMFKGL